MHVMDGISFVFDLELIIQDFQLGSDFAHSCGISTLDGEKISLTRTEYDILKLLMEHPGQVFSPNHIYEQVWKDNPYGTENTVAVHIRHLREKVEYNPAEPRYLKVVWGRGYKIEDTRY